MCDESTKQILAYYSDSDDEDNEPSGLSDVMRGLLNTWRHDLGYVDQNNEDDHFEGPHRRGGRCEITTKTLNASQFSLMTKQTSGAEEARFKKLKKDNVVQMVIDRASGVYNRNGFCPRRKCQISNLYLPNTNFILDHSTDKIFCGVFSKDGNRFITAAQDRTIRIYNSEKSSYKFQHFICARDVGWSILDVAFSPNGEHFVYSTWSSSLHLCPVYDTEDNQETLSINNSRRFCIFSVKFSSDGKELVGGANDGFLYIYDLERHKRIFRIPAHEHDIDVNCVMFADDSSQIIYSGGDDGQVKVWDRRTLREIGPKPVGILAGHTNGITFIDSKGDGRHLISNSKDQSIKLWDIRVFSDKGTIKRARKVVAQQNWDYRWESVPRRLGSMGLIDGDTSVMTFKGHVVTKTLMRCRFSPLGSTGQRYIYTGCGMGRVVIYDALTGKLVKALGGHQSCVRDVDWHPVRNEILSSSWDRSVRRWVYHNKQYVDEEYSGEEL
ncbi:DDB1- and CUL4-associated factor 11 isoform X1 [Diorhabda sublineata]|uniref:DDB1- and CUL4-associated factor 11 isoform X1 n=2 Tax=Diorhabda sublineata TaxID=1163346 RepID=UPI0024E09B44|nr:DDB1- and CUL4-associated factor 11 isoform X1 [Diorhabda sublineata]